MALTKISGSILKDPLNLGEVSIGGTLTYQDVTNVDSVGVITARTGINVSGGQLDVGNNIKIGNAGIITATELDISGDIDVDGHTNLDNVSIVGIVTISAGVNNEGLRITGQNNNAVIFTSPSINGSAGYRLNHHPSTNVLRVDTTDQNGTYTGIVASFSSNGLDMADNIKLRLGTSQDLTLYHYGNDAYIDNATGSILFRQGGSEKVRISSSGDITASHSGLAVNIFESTDNHSRLRIKSSDASLAQLEFADQTDADAGEIRYDHGNDRMTFHVGSNVERFSIDSDGELTSTANNNGQIIHSFKNDNTTAGSSAMTVEHWFRFNRSGGGMNASAARIIAGKEREWIGGASNQDGYFAVHTTADETSSEKMRISSGGIMTRPYQPAFSMQGLSSPSDSSEGYTGILSNYITITECNVGGHYKTSGTDQGKFVAPVNGNYFFSAGVLLRLRSGSSGSGELTFYKNGSNISARSLGYSYVLGTNDHDNVTITSIISLTAGDKVHLVSHACSSNLDWYWGQGLGNFSGYLIG